MDWIEARERARPLLDGVTRGRVAARESGTELAYLDWGGDGELVVMHHANGFCAATLAIVAVGLREQYRVVAIDARGHGDSTARMPSDDPESYLWPNLAGDYASAIEAICERVGRPQARLGIGHSFGGVLTLAAAAMRPGLVGEILLLDPVILPRRVSGVASPPDRGAELAASTRMRRDRFPTREEAFTHFSSRGLFTQFLPEALALYVGEGLVETGEGDLRLKCAPEVEAAIFKNGSSLDTFAIAPKVEAPTRFLFAERGNFVRALYDELAAEMPSARVEDVDGAHLFPMERPHLVLDAIGAG